jgi:hypothetical protein
VLFAFIGSACGDDPDPVAVSCEWFRSEDNCWRAVVAEAGICTPDYEGFTPGIFSDDRLVCEYPPDGAAVVGFSVSPLEPPTPDFTLDIDRGGEACLSYTSTDTSVVLETKSGTYTATLEGSQMDIVCPDGSRYRVNDVAQLADCHADLPGHQIRRNQNWATVLLLGMPEFRHFRIEIADCWVR